jgi:hypothetical protein
MMRSLQYEDEHGYNMKDHLRIFAESERNYLKKTIMEDG